MLMRQCALHRFNYSGHIGPIFWTCQPNASVQFSLVITTSDAQPILIDWGDGTIESCTSGVAKTHTYATADGTKQFSIRIADPERVTKIEDDGTTGVRRGTLTLSQFVNVTDIRIRKSSCTGTLDLSANVKLSGAHFYTNSFSGTLDLSANVLLVYAWFMENSFTGSLDLTANVLLAYANFYNNGFTSINATGCNKITTLSAHSNPNLTAVTGWSDIAVNGANIRIYACSVTAANIDTALLAFDAAGLTGKYFDYKAQTGDGHLDGNRSAGAATAITNLETKTWSIVRA